MFEKINLRRDYIYLLGMASLIIASIFSKGYHHFDEHFQILEFAGVKLGLTTPSNLPWEYHYQMRPALQPSLVVILYRFLAVFGIDNPFFITFVLRLMSGGLTFVSMLLLYNIFKNKIRDTILKGGFSSFLLLFGAPYIPVCDFHQKIGQVCYSLLGSHAIFFFKNEISYHFLPLAYS